MITDPLKLFVVEYSMSQDATSVHSFRKMVENNLRNLGEGKYTDYLPIGIFLTRDQADSFCVCLRQRQDQVGWSQSNRDWPLMRNIVADLLPRQLNNLNWDQRQPYERIEFNNYDGE